MTTLGKYVAVMLVLGGSPHEEAQALLDKAVASIKEGKLARAEPQLNECLDRDPTMAECHLQLGVVAEGQKAPAKAVQHYREFLRLAPNHPRTAEIQEALRKLSATVTPGAEEAQSNFEEGKRLLKLRQYKEAQVSLRKCVDLDPNNAECHLALGSTFARLRDPEKGMEQYREFLRLAPDHPKAADIRKLMEDYEAQKAKPR